LLGILVRLGMFDVAVPRYVVTAASRPVEPTAVRDDMGLLDAIAADWPTSTGSDVDPSRVRWLVQAAGGAPRGKVICSVWFGVSEFRDAVVKVSRSPTPESSIRDEHQALVALKAYGDHASMQVPRPLWCKVVRDREVAAETVVPGRTLAAHMDEHGPPPVRTFTHRFSGWIQWLADLHARSSRVASDQELETCLYEPMRRVVEELGLSSDQASMVQSVERRAAELATLHPLRLVFAHNDLGPSNVLVSPNGEAIGVVDWEFAGPGLPATDLIYFLARLADEITAGRRARPSWDFETTFGAHAPRSANGPASLARRWLDHYSSRLDLAPEWLPILFVSCWIHHARNEHRKAQLDHPLPHDTEGFFRRRLEESLQMLDELQLTSDAG
jgi:Ser/Thr protein kinase RdoA (MazF antagonist)